MQTADVVTRTGCPSYQVLRLVQHGLVLPVRKGEGSGNHHFYDDANLVVVGVIDALSKGGLKPEVFEKGFIQLHQILRGRPRIEWFYLKIILTKDGVRQADSAVGLESEQVVHICIDVGRIAALVMPQVIDFQLQLNFGIQSISGRGDHESVAA